MTDLERALTGQEIIDCMRQDGGQVPSDGHYYVKLIDSALAAARREGEQEAWAQLSKIETEAFIRGRESGRNLAALEEKYGSFDAKVQAQMAAARQEGAAQMRERAALTAEKYDCGGPVWDGIVAAIRALPLSPEEPA